MRSFLLISIFLVGCGKESLCNDHFFDAYKEDFQEEASRHGLETRKMPPISFSDDLPDDIRGICLNEKAILINRALWIDNPLASASENNNSKRGLIFHELGHCVFKMNHTEHGIMQVNAPEYPTSKEYRQFFESEASK